jgi:hypothetical protein
MKKEKKEIAFFGLILKLSKAAQKGPTISLMIQYKLWVPMKYLI